MTAFADTNNPTPFGNDSTLAGIGDPFDPDQTAFGRIEATTVVASVPNPISLHLLAIGLVGLLLSQRKMRGRDRQR